MDSWNKIKRDVLNRDNWTCQVCKKSHSSQVHHIIPRSSGGSDNVGNLITLCNRCHVLVSPVPDSILTKVWGIPSCNIKEERRRVKDAIEDYRMYPKDLTQFEI